MDPRDLITKEVTVEDLKKAWTMAGSKKLLAAGTKGFKPMAAAGKIGMKGASAMGRFATRHPVATTIGTAATTLPLATGLAAGAMLGAKKKKKKSFSLRG